MDRGDYKFQIAVLYFVFLKLKPVVIFIVTIFPHQDIILPEQESRLKMNSLNTAAGVEPNSNVQMLHQQIHNSSFPN